VGIGIPLACKIVRTRTMAKSGVKPCIFDCGSELIELVIEMEGLWDTIKASNSNCGITMAVGARQATRSWKAMVQNPYEWYSHPWMLKRPL